MRANLLAAAIAVLAWQAAPAAALQGGADDPDTAQNNATVSIDHGHCSGTLIAPRLVLTAGHCQDYEPPNTPRVDGSYVATGQWHDWRNISVQIGPDPATTDAARNFTAKWMTQAGWADLVLFMLDTPVPASLATPAPPLTRLNAAQRVPGYWSTQTFIAAGFGGGRPRRQTATWRNGAFPCKTADVVGGDEFICALSHPGSELEGGDSGGPLYWVGPGGRRFVVGVTQGNAQPLRLCNHATSEDPASCDPQPLPILTTASGCQRATGATANVQTWRPWHHTATFAVGGHCFTDANGETFHQPNIAAFLDDAVLWAPTADQARIVIAVQNVTPPNGGAPHPEMTATPSDVVPTIASARFLNPHAPGSFPHPWSNALWAWRIDGSDQLYYTITLHGDTFSHPTENGLSLSSPHLIGYLWGDADGVGPNGALVRLYRNDLTHAFLTTWDLPALVPDAAERAHWMVVRGYGLVERIPPPPNVHLSPNVLRPTPLPIQRQIITPVTPH